MLGNFKSLSDFNLKLIEPEKKYNEDGILVYKKKENGVEEWYDENRRLIKRETNGVRNETNLEIEYDEDGNEVYYKRDHFEEWKEYDEDGNVIYYKSSNYTEWEKEYNSIGEEIYYKDLLNDIERWQLGEGDQLVKRDSNYYYNGKLCEKINPEKEIKEI